MTFRRRALDPNTTDRLLSGQLATDDAPPAYREVAKLLSLAHVDDHDGAAETVNDDVIVAMVGAIVDRAPRPRGTSVVTKLLTLKAAAATTALVVLTAGTAAATTGNLPAAAQDGLASAARRIGINLPESAHEHDATDDETPKRHQPGETTEDDGADDPHSAREDRGAVVSGPTSAEDPGVPPAEAPGRTDPANDNHGAPVSDTAHDADAEGGKGDEVAPIARSGDGAANRNGNGAANGTGAGSGNANGAANGNGAVNGNGAGAADGHANSRP